MHENLLTSLPVPDLTPAQLDLITDANIHARLVEHFDPQAAREALTKNEGKKILAIDFGGGKATKIIWEVKNGGLKSVENSVHTVIKEGSGENYLQFFQDAAQQAKDAQLDVAISFGGPLESTKPIAIPNAPGLMTALKTEYDGDFARLFPTLKAINNDAQAGIKAAALAANAKNIIFPINGGGFGLAMLIDNEIIATEIGHVQLFDELNIHDQQTPCGILGHEYVCLERAAASGAGIEDLWKKITGEHANGKEISEKYQAGNETARTLYNNAAVLIAHGIVGAAKTKNLLQNANDATIVFHGGGFRVPDLKERITQIIAKNLGFTPKTMFTDDFSPNACAEGVAIAALCQNG